MNILLFLAGALILSQFYPNGYNFWENTISSLGSYKKNPIGAFWWNLILFIFAIILSGNISFIYQQIQNLNNFLTLKQSRNKRIRKINLLLVIFAIVGIFGVSIFPEELGVIHVIFAVMFYFGIVIWLNIVIWWAISLKDLVKY